MTGGTRSWDQWPRWRVTGRRTRGHLGAFTENATEDEMTEDDAQARRMAEAWAHAGFTVWLMERRPPVPGFTASGGPAWATVETFSPRHPFGHGTPGPGGRGES